MIIDKNNALGDAQAVTVTAPSTDHIDLLAAGDALGGSELYFVALVDTAFTAVGAATLTIDLECDDNTSFSSSKILFSSGAIAKTALVAGYRAVAVKIPVGCERFVRANFTVATGPMTAGKIDTFVVKDIDVRQP